MLKVNHNGITLLLESEDFADYVRKDTELKEYLTHRFQGNQSKDLNKFPLKLDLASLMEYSDYVHSLVIARGSTIPIIEIKVLALCKRSVFNLKDLNGKLKLETEKGKALESYFNFKKLHPNQKNPYKISVLRAGIYNLIKNHWIKNCCCTNDNDILRYLNNPNLLLYIPDIDSTLWDLDDWELWYKGIGYNKYEKKLFRGKKLPSWSIRFGNRCIDGNNYDGFFFLSDLFYV